MESLGAVIRRPLNQDEQIAAFGDPRPYMLADGGISPDWERSILGWADLPQPLPLSWKNTIRVKRFRCHILLSMPFTDALIRCNLNPGAWATVNDFGGCYNFRTNRRNNKSLSKHAWGTAIDIDVCDNPQGRKPRIHPWIVESFEQHGFMWGGLFKGKSKDGMHFEFVDVGRLS